MTKKLSEEFKQNKPTWIWRGTVLVLIGVLSFLGSWIFTEVSAAPKVYQTKEEQRAVDNRQDTEIRAIRSEVQEGFKETQRIILDLHK